MSPCKINVNLNDQKLEYNSEIKAENHGRTTHDNAFIPSDQNELEVIFLSGLGVLFLDYFELLIKVESSIPA